jgi:hypothetical protein
MIWVYACAVLLAASPVVLDNARIRVEIDPELFSIRFVGAPGGRNFLEPLFVEENTRRSGDWADPGGLVTDVLGLEERDAALRRGPAVVADQSAVHVLLIGPESRTTGLRLKKEITLAPDTAAARLTCSLLSNRPEAQRLALRNMVRVAPGATIRLPRRAGDLRSLSGAPATAPLVVKSMLYWLMPVPPTSPVRETLLGSESASVELQSENGVWTRRSAAMASPEAFPKGQQSLALLDDATKSYGLALQSPEQEVSLAHPLVWTEEWTFDARGK